MNRFERNFGFKGEAKLRYLDGEVQVITPGEFVRCAVTGQTIPIDELRYWSSATRTWVQDETTFDVYVGGDSTATLSSSFELRRG